MKVPIRERWGQFIAGFFCCRWMATLLLVFLLDICTWLAFKDVSGTPSFNGQDKVLHALAFLVLSVIGHISLRFDLFPNSGRSNFWIFPMNWTVCMGYGVFIEFVQMHLSHRSASIGDLIADGVGVLLGTFTVLFLKLYPRSSKTR